MERRWLVLPALLLLHLLASPAGADTVTIKYEVSAGTVDTLDGLFPVTSGTFSVIYTSSGLAPIDGPAVLNTLALAAEGFTFSGSFHDSFTLGLKSPVGGAGTSNTGFVNTLRLDLIGDFNVHCYVSYSGSDYCPDYGLEASVSKNFGMSGYANSGNLAIGKVAMDEVDFLLESAVVTIPDFTVGTGAIWLRGREIERVPEADPGLMMLSALAMIVALFRLRGPRTA